MSDQSGLEDMVAKVREETTSSPPPPILPTKEQENSSPWVDVDGVKFDPTIHHIGARDGRPKMVGGKFKVRAGREIDDINARRTALEDRKKKETERVQLIPENPLEIIDRKNAANATAGLIFALLQTAGGKSWGPQTEPVDEFPLLANAFDEYYKAIGIKKAPPEVGLAMALAVILLAPNRVGGLAAKKFKKNKGDSLENNGEIK